MEKRALGRKAYKNLVLQPMRAFIYHNRLGRVFYLDFRSLSRYHRNK